jgi:hypothetical protein
VTPPTDDLTLDRFQTALLELLAEPLGVDEILGRLANDPAFAPYADYVAGFEPRMVEVAAELVKRWGRLRPGAGA